MQQKFIAPLLIFLTVNILLYATIESQAISVDKEYLEEAPALKRVSRIPHRKKTNNPPIILSSEMPELDLPKPNRVVLDNGLVIYLLSNNNLPVTEVTAYIKAGYLHDPLNKSGTSRLLSLLLRTASIKRINIRKMNRFLNEQNIVIKSTMLSDACEVTFDTILNFADAETSYRFKKAFYIYSQLLRNPKINPTNVHAAQKVLLSKIRRESDDPRILAEQEFKKLVFGKNHPQSYYPTKDSIESVTLNDLYNFHQRYFQPNRIILAISGSFDDNQMIKLIKKFFGSWKNKKTIYPKIPDVILQPNAFHFFAKNVAQTSLIIGHIGPRIPHKNYLPLLLANEILGKATLSNKLFKRIRSQLGLVYFINSKIDSNPFSQGMIKISCQTDEKKSIRVLYETKRVLKAFVRHKVTEKELREVKQSYLNSLTTSLNSYHKIVQYFSLHEHYGFAPNFLYLFIQHINEITSDDILRVAQQYLHPDHLIMVMVGKSPNFKNHLLPRVISDDAIYQHSTFR